MPRKRGGTGDYKGAALIVIFENFVKIFVDFFIEKIRYKDKLITTRLYPFIGYCANPAAVEDSKKSLISY